MRKLCLERVHELSGRDQRVVYIGSDPGPGTMSQMKDEFPDRCFIEGIAEQNLIGMAAGLAIEGFIPFVNTISTFLTRRCFEQVAIDLCLHNLPVRMIGNGGGFVYAPLGPTHTAVEDISIMRALPNMTIVSVADAEEMGRFMDLTLDWPGPIYIRLAKGYDPIVTKPDWGFEIGKGIVARDGGDVVIVTSGVLLGPVLQAAEDLAADGVDATVLHMPTIKPFDESLVAARCGDARLVVTCEENTRVGGLGAAVLEALADAGRPIPRTLRLGIGDVWTHNYGSQKELLADYGLTEVGIADAVRSALSLN